MFNGAKKYGPGDLDKVMEANGGSNNAYTTRDVTVYQDWFPRSALPLIYDIESDRIRDLSFDPAEGEVRAGSGGVGAAAQRGQREQRSARRAVVGDVFIAHPYQWPVVGWMSDIEHWTMEDLKHHFEMGYSPNNATMVVVGDVSAGRNFQALRDVYRADSDARAAAAGDDRRAAADWASGDWWCTSRRSCRC